MKEYKYNCKGDAIFNSWEEESEIYYDIGFKDSPRVIEVINDHYTGIDFLEAIKDLTLTDYDGWVDKVFLNGYITNIRLFGYNIDFYDDNYINFNESSWIDLCKNYKVDVYWVNK